MASDEVAQQAASLSSTLRPAYTFKLGGSILPGKVALGYFGDPEQQQDALNASESAHGDVYPSLVCALAGGRVLVHRAHAGRSGRGSETETLTFGREVTCIGCGRLGNDTSSDAIIAGSQADLRAYDPNSNSDVFFRDIPDGANVVTVGRIGSLSELAVIGGTCSVYGYNADGDDDFWLVTGDNVSAVAVLAGQGAKDNTVAVACADRNVRVFNEDQDLIAEISLSDAANHLVPIGQGFAYSLSNGSVGLYTSLEQRSWEYQAKFPAIDMVLFDIDGDGTPELITGQSDGTVECRRLTDGTVIATTRFKSPVAGLVKSDYRREGFASLLVVCKDGTVHGIHPAGASSSRVDEPKQEYHVAIDKEALEKLRRQRQKLQAKLRHLQTSQTGSAVSKKTAAAAAERAAMAAEISVEWSPQPAHGHHPAHIRVDIDCSDPDICIHGALLQCPVMFKSGFSVVSADSSRPSSKLVGRLPPFSRHSTADVEVIAFVAPSGSDRVLAKHLSLHLPTFAFFVKDEGNLPASTGPEYRLSIPFDARRAPEVAKWSQKMFRIKQSIAGAGDLVISLNDVSLSCALRIVISKGKLMIVGTNQDSVRSVMHELVKDLGGGLKTSDIEEHRSSVAHGDGQDQSERKVVGVMPQGAESVSVTRPSGSAPMDENPSGSASPSIQRALHLSRPVSSDLAGNKLARSPSAARRRSSLARSTSLRTGPTSPQPSQPEADSEALSRSEPAPSHAQNMPSGTESITKDSEEDELFNAVMKIQDTRGVSQKLAMEAAEQAALIKALLIRIEDARVLGDLSSLRDALAEFQAASHDAIRMHTIRQSNHKEMAASAAQLNRRMERLASALEGQERSDFLNSCRSALRDEDFHKLYQILVKQQ